MNEGLSRKPVNGLQKAQDPPQSTHPKPFKPRPSHEKALHAAISDPKIAFNRAGLAKATGMSNRTIEEWFGRQDFREWWNRMLTQVAQQSFGPALMTLQQIIGDEEVSSAVKVKAVDTMLKHTAAPGESTATAVAAILEKWGGSSSLRIAAKGDAIAVELGQLKDGTHPDLDQEQVVQSGPPTPNQMAAGVVRSIQATVHEETRREEIRAARDQGKRNPDHPVTLGDCAPRPKIDPKGKGGSESPADPGGAKGPHTQDFAQSPDYPSSSPDDGSGGGEGAEGVPRYCSAHRDPEPGCAACGVPELPDGERLDAMGKPYRPRGEGELKPPPGGGEVGEEF